MDNIFSKKSVEELADIAIGSIPNLELLSYFGHLAPSVHNTQPWLIEIIEKTNTIKVNLDPAKGLEHSDPTNRQGWLSIGAFVENVVYVAENLGLKTSIEQAGEGAILEFKTSAKYKISRKSVASAISAVVKRQTNRRIFNKQPINQQTYRAIADSVSKSGSPKTLIVRDLSIIDELSMLSESAVKLAFSSKDLRSELNEYINPMIRDVDVGIPSLALAPSFIEATWAKLSVKSGFFLNINARKESQKIKSVSALGLIFTKGDTKADWFAAGVEYEKLCLTLTKLGLAHSTNAVLVEAPDYYKEVGDLLGNKMRLQILIRIGYADSVKKKSGRVPLQSVLHVSNNPI